MTAIVHLSGSVIGTPRLRRSKNRDLTWCVLDVQAGENGDRHRVIAYEPWVDRALSFSEGEGIQCAGTLRYRYHDALKHRMVVRDAEIVLRHLIEGH